MQVKNETEANFYIASLPRNVKEGDLLYKSIEILILAEKDRARKEVMKDYNLINADK